jgi:hypothetical protein
LALIGTTTVATGTWYHLAFVRNGTSVKLYVNGVEEASNTLSANFNIDVGDTTDSWVGGTAFGTDSYYNGYIDELRVSNTARYTANFTPSTTPFQNDANTLLLLHMDGTDGSTAFFDDNGIAPYTP